jgi:hypothetical protein
MSRPAGRSTARAQGFARGLRQPRHRTNWRSRVELADGEQVQREMRRINIEYWDRL